MEDPVLNTALEETRELQTRWSQFHDFVVMAMKGQPITPQAEMKFLELKSRIAMLHDSFMTGLKHSHKTGQNIMQIVGDCILLKRCADWSDAEKQKFEFDWNEAYLLINEQLTTLEEEKKRLAAINPRVYRARQRKELLLVKLHAFYHSLGFKVAVVAVVLFMLLWGIPAFGIYDYRNFKNMAWSRPTYEFIVKYVYRPFINRDFPYDAIAEIPRVPPGSIQRERTRREQNAPTRNDFTSRVLFEIGGTPENIAELRELAGKVPNEGFISERWVADNQEARFFFLLFPTSEDAKRFVEICRRGVQTYPPDRQAVIRTQVFMQRKANFVMIGISQHLMSKVCILEEFKLKPDTPSLLL